MFVAVLRFTLVGHDGKVMTAELCSHDPHVGILAFSGAVRNVGIVCGKGSLFQLDSFPGIKTKLNLVSFFLMGCLCRKKFFVWTGEHQVISVTLHNTYIYICAIPIHNIYIYTYSNVYLQI